MSFVVYVNDRKDYAKVHDEDCRFYQNRKGDRLESGFWKGPFQTLRDASNYAYSIGKEKIERCDVCL